MKDTIPTRVYLIGMMASGKSTIAKILAEYLGYEFIDMDGLIEEREGRSIFSIFKNEGENYFRKVEKKILKECSKQQNVVVSTGGGAPIYYDGIDVMNNTGIVIWLKVSIDSIVLRLQNDERRPLLVNADKEKIVKLLTERIPTYSKATIRVWNRGDVDIVTKRILNKL